MKLMKILCRLQATLKSLYVAICEFGEQLFLFKNFELFKL